MNRICFILIVFALFPLKTFGFAEDCTKLSHRIISQYSKELSRKKGLCLIGRGGAMLNDIQEISVHYVSRKKLSVPEARRLYVEIAEEFLARINQNEKLRPFLHNYPFTIQNLALRISFEDEIGRIRGENCVAYVCRNNEGKIYYANFELQELKDLYQETYEEAFNIVIQEKNFIKAETPVACSKRNLSPHANRCEHENPLRRINFFRR